jgi:hypothetical protein
MLDKYRMPNDNVFIWLGTTEKKVNNVLILAGGDVLFLEAIRTLSLMKEEVRNDIRTLDPSSLIKKYELPIDDFELLGDLKRGVETKQYPPYSGIGAQEEYKSMIWRYISLLLSVRNPVEKVAILDGIIDECRKRKLALQGKG